MMYSAESSSSSSVADMPRLSSTGLRARPAALQQREVLHVARADLDAVGVLVDELQRLVVDRLGDDREVELLAHPRQDLEPLLAESLEGVRRGARLVRAAAEQLPAGALDPLGDGARLVERLDRAGAADHDDAVAADVDAADVDDRVVRLRLAADQLVRRARRG